MANTRPRKPAHRPNALTLRIPELVAVKDTSELNHNFRTLEREVRAREAVCSQAVNAAADGKQ